jgi:O-antigen ligase
MLFEGGPNDRVEFVSTPSRIFELQLSRRRPPNVLAIPSLEVALIFGAACYSIFGWALPTALSGGESLTSVSADQLSQSNLFNQLVWISLLPITLVFIRARLESGLRILPTISLVLLCCYLVLCTASFFWALAPDIVIRRIVQQFIIVLVFFCVPAFARERIAVLNTIYVALGIAVMINVCLFPLIPSTPLGYAGIYPQKNLLGAVSATTLIFSFFLMVSPLASYKSFVFVTALFSGLLLVLSRSKTSLGLAVICPCLAVAVFTTSRLLKVSFKIASLLISVAGLVVLFGVMWVADLSATDISLLLFNDTTFTGRTIIWSFVSPYINQRLWLGWGYQSFWNVGAESPNLNATDFVSGLVQSHNGYMDILIETGVVGFAIVLGFIAGLFNAIENRWKRRADVSLLLLSLLFFCIAHNLLESSLTRGFHPLWIVLLVIAGCSIPSVSIRHRN